MERELKVLWSWKGEKRRDYGDHPDDTQKNEKPRGEDQVYK